MDEKFNLGYTKDSSPLCVGDCCATKLREVVLRVMNFPLPYEVPPKNARLWRYMDFTKFVSLLSKKALQNLRTVTLEGA